MKLVGKLKERVYKTKSLEEAKEVIREAGMELTDIEMEQIAGGGSSSAPAQVFDAVFHKYESY